ncbi:hypothetical protein [Acetobacter sp. DsW_063]|uniref:hypothetical protein n=1 Tax=Acetobacter sp. DsW_063 TaxID=1514894 RepID=UPI000A38D0A7|nr:hypothetical protein [Acetobacter sp. DsW_063]OUJ15765.1 hypothetical protein HK28_07050 [Acetobacter sp. DsW_063]
MFRLIGLANIVYNMRRFLFLQRISAAAWQAREGNPLSTQGAERKSAPGTSNQHTENRKADRR